MLPLVWSFFIFLVGCYAQGGPEEPAEPEEQKWVAVLTSEIEVCEDELSLAFIDPKALETFVYNDSISYMHGDIGFLQPIEAGYTAELKLEKVQNGKREIAMTTCINVCSELLNPDSDFYFILKHFQVDGKCPFDAGFYLLQQFILDLTDLPVNGANSGCYQATITFFNGPCDDKEKVFLACIYLTFCIEPLE